MAISCPECGRQFDVTLFQFGQHVRCVCGSRVELAATQRVVPGRRFVADVMLGRLARWLRMLGQDTAYDPDATDEALLRCAGEERRMLLTRDRALAERAGPAHGLLVGSEELSAQLRQVVRGLGLDWRSGLFSRCTRCNGRLLPASKQFVAGKAPTRVLLEQQRFARCVDCGRIYWHGSHTRRARRALERTLGE